MHFIFGEQGNVWPGIFLFVGLCRSFIFRKLTKNILTIKNFKLKLLSDTFSEEAPRALSSFGPSQLTIKNCQTLIDHPALNFKVLIFSHSNFIIYIAYYLLFTVCNLARGTTFTCLVCTASSGEMWTLSQYSVINQLRVFYLSIPRHTIYAIQHYKHM